MTFQERLLASDFDITQLVAFRYFPRFCVPLEGEWHKRLPFLEISSQAGSLCHGSKTTLTVLNKQRFGLTSRRSDCLSLEILVLSASKRSRALVFPSGIPRLLVVLDRAISIDRSYGPLQLQIAPGSGSSACSFSGPHIYDLFTLSSLRRFH